MDEDLISKKELLERYGISYGALYRWKRMGLIPESWVPAPFDAERTGDVFSHEADLPARGADPGKQGSASRWTRWRRSWPGRSRRRAAERKLILETKYGSKTYSLDELLHLYLAEGEHKTDILEHLKEEAL